MASVYEKQFYGLRGNINETGTTAHTGVEVSEIVCLTQTVFAALTDELTDSTSDSLVGVTLPAGTVLKGYFTAFTLTSGAVRAYKTVRLP